jgi:hypothetical protein
VLGGTLQTNMLVVPETLDHVGLCSMLSGTHAPSETSLTSVLRCRSANVMCAGYRIATSVITEPEKGTLAAVTATLSSSALLDAGAAPPD